MSEQLTKAVCEKGHVHQTNAGGLDDSIIAAILPCPFIDGDGNVCAKRLVWRRPFVAGPRRFELPKLRRHDDSNIPA